MFFFSVCRNIPKLLILMMNMNITIARSSIIIISKFASAASAYRYVHPQAGMVVWVFMLSWRGLSQSFDQFIYITFSVNACLTVEQNSIMELFASCLSSSWWIHSRCIHPVVWPQLSVSEISLPRREGWIPCCKISLIGKLIYLPASMNSRHSSFIPMQTMQVLV